MIVCTTVRILLLISCTTSITSPLSNSPTLSALPCGPARTVALASTMYFTDSLLPTTGSGSGSGSGSSSGSGTAASEAFRASNRRIIAEGTFDDAGLGSGSNSGSATSGSGSAGSSLSPEPSELSSSDSSSRPSSSIPFSSSYSCWRCSRMPAPSLANSSNAARPSFRHRAPLLPVARTVARRGSSSSRASSPKKSPGAYVISVCPPFSASAAPVSKKYITSPTSPAVTIGTPRGNSSASTRSAIFARWYSSRCCSSGTLLSRSCTEFSATQSGFPDLAVSDTHPRLMRTRVCPPSPTTACSTSKTSLAARLPRFSESAAVCSRMTPALSERYEPLTSASSSSASSFISPPTLFLSSSSDALKPRDGLELDSECVVSSADDSPLSDIVVAAGPPTSAPRRCRWACQAHHRQNACVHAA